MGEFDKFSTWPAGLAGKDWTPQRLHTLYNNGLMGAFCDEEASEKLQDSLEYKNYGEVCDELELWDSRVEDGLYLPYLAVVACEAKRLGIDGSIADLSRDDRINPWNERQDTGDCVSHWLRNHCDQVRACEIIWQDELEEWIVRTATEPLYGHRGHADEGANCARLLDYAMNVGGMMLRQKYTLPEVGELDLSKYNAQIGMAWGARGVPQSVRTEGQKHQIRNGTLVNDLEQAVQVYRNGLAIGGCSDIAYSPERNEDGVARVEGSWAHAMFGGGMDERPATIRKYGGRLFLDINSWGKWNKGPRKIMGTDYYIPHGSCWVREKDYVARKLKSYGGTYVLAGANGWEVSKLIDWGAMSITKKGW